MRSLQIIWVTSGLFNRLDGIIAYPEETAYLQLSFGVVQTGVLQDQRTQYA
jgi:hypothetical protein